jgi:PAP2 superfamily
MTHSEASAAWRLFTYNWFPLGAMALVLAGALGLTDFSIKPTSMLLPLGAVVVYGGAAYYNALTPHRRDPPVIFILGATAQLLLISLLMTPLTYIAAALDLPMQDAHLAALDRALGLDWRGYLDFFNDRPQLIGYLVLGYAMIAWPVFGVPIVLGAARQYERLQQFTLAFALALIATTVLSTLTPALGTYYELGLTPADHAHITPGGFLDQLRDFPRVRDGSLRQLDIKHLVGIITFPSFHAAAAALYLWAFWAVWWMRPLALMTNGMMLLATPIGGGHYFVDVFAGMGVAVLAIVAARWIGERVMQPVRTQAVLPEGVPTAVSSPIQLPNSR